MKRVIFEFPNEDAAECFLAWFSTQGHNFALVGETDEFIKENGGVQRKPISNFDYSRAFETWGYDPKIHGDDLIVKAIEGE